MALNVYERFAYKMLGPYVRRGAESNAHLSLSLRKAHIMMRPDVYLSYSFLNMILAFLATLLLVIFLGIFYAAGMIDIPGAIFSLLVPLPPILAVTLYLLTFSVPDMKARSRARDIEAKLPYALSYISTMASAGVTPQGVFRSLANQKLYGEVSREAALITRDLEVMGRDVVSALTDAIDRSPSIKFQDLLQGAITTLSSGGDLKHYFLAKSEQFLYENRAASRRFLDNLSVLAESFVTVVVAAPLFLIVLLSVAMTFGGGGKDMLILGYVLILFMLPLAQVGFVFAVQSITPEV